jgi:hypothetical protein
MEFLSILAGLDNLRKLAVILGLGLLAMGTLYPLQKTMQLNEKKIKIDELNKLNDIEVNDIRAHIKSFTEIEEKHSEKIKKIKSEIDSLFKLSLNDEIKFRITFLQNEVNECQKQDELELKVLREKTTLVGKSDIKKETLADEAANLEAYISIYKIVEVIAVILGIFFLIYGLINWKKSENDSDELKRIQIQIQKEELKKIQNANGTKP